MSPESENRLNIYRKINNKVLAQDVCLVEDIETGILYIEKTIRRECKDLYEKLKEYHFKNIPYIREIIDVDDSIIVIEEYINGRSFSERVAKRDYISENDAIKLMIELSEILRQLHSCNPPVIHRDIKPSNIMMTDDGKLYLIDFDAAREYDSDESEDTEYMGTKFYAAPEQFGFAQSDERTDIYSIGATINVLLCGESVKNRIYEGKLKSIIKKCTSIDPNMRFQDVSELINALNLVETGGVYNYSYDNKIITSKGKRWKDFLPVGFRKFNPLFNILACLWYVMIVDISLFANFESDGEPEIGLSAMTSRLSVFLLLLLWTGLYGNYLNVWKYLPGLDKKTGIIMKCIALIGYMVVIFLLVVFLMVLIKEMVKG